MATDTFGRRIDYLRISVTDRCNLRCVYCMPPDGIEWKAHEDILSFEEIERFARIAAGEGISKIRLTGGEPLVRLGIVDHVRRLRETTGIEAIALTTNGTLLSQYAADLAAAGLKRINISLDTLDPDVYTSITRRGRLDDVLEGMEAAFDAGMDPVKLNVVVVRSLDQDLLGFARMTLDPDKPMVALSFDDGPMAGVTDQILTILQQYNARATFFVCGWRLSQPKNQEMLRRMAALGCEIGNHTWSHANISEENYVAVRYEIESTNDAVFEATGLRPRCFRPPGGVNSYDATRVTREDNMYIVLWSQSGNVNEFDPKRIAQNVDKQIVDGKELHAGDVILLHDTHECMVDAVKIIVPRLIAEGYQLVTVWELLNCSGIPLVPGELYQN